MAKRTWGALADVIEDLVDKDQADSTFDTFVQTMLSMTLQEIISHVPHARWLLEEHSITLTASQQYVTMPADLDLDAIVSLRDNTNNKRGIKIDAAAADLIDPGRDLTGDVVFWWFQRVGGVDRLYFIPQPDAADSLSLIGGEIITDPAAGASSALPAKYEWVLIAGTLVKVWERVDPEHNTAKWESIYQRGLGVILNDANDSPGASEVLSSHRPNLVASSPHGPSFPADYDVLP